MDYKLWERFPAELKKLDEAPEPLRSSMRKILKEEDHVRFLVFGPADKILGRVSPATILAVLEQEWALVVGLESGPIQVVRVKFSDTLLLELTIILLYGRLTFDYLDNGRVASVDVKFNTVMGRLYQRALRLVLDGIHNIGDESLVLNTDLDQLFEGMPIKFANAIREFKPPSQKIVASIHLATVIIRKWNWIFRELSPEAVLVLAEREIIYISEEKGSSWFSYGSSGKYGYLITYCPLSHLAAYRVAKNPPVGRMELKILIGDKGETLRVGYPLEKSDELEKFMGGVMKGQDKWHF